MRAGNTRLLRNILAMKTPPFAKTGSGRTQKKTANDTSCYAGHPSGIKKAINTPKHFTGQLFEGDSSDPWGNGTTVNRQSNDTRYVLRDLEQYYLPAFKAAMINAEVREHNHNTTNQCTLMSVCVMRSERGCPERGRNFCANRRRAPLCAPTKE